jgi:hypothetical protein
MERWRRQLEALRDGEAPERAMIMRWFERPDVSLFDPLLSLLFRESSHWVALYELDAPVGAPATIVFPVADGTALQSVDQEGLVWVRGVTDPGHAVIVTLAGDEVEPAGRPRRPKAADPTLVGEL